MPKHIFFDLDDTLTKSRSVMDEKYQPLFATLCTKKDVVIVSGAQESQIRTQIPESLGAESYILAQHGNHVVDKARTVLWQELLDSRQIEIIMRVIEIFKKELNITVSNEDDLIENRGSQIGYSILGHHEASAKKYAYDPGSVKRLSFLKAHPRELAELREAGVGAQPGGTTSIDFILAGKHKGFNIARLIEHEGWKKDECLYLGDALFSGGNDETVIGVIPTKAVENPDECFEFIKNLLS